MTSERPLPTNQEVVEALRSAGWLLEQEVEGILRDAGYHTVMGDAFPDPDDATVSREIDVTGYRQVHRSDDLGLSVGVRVIAECKQSTMPYVLIGNRERNPVPRERMEQQLRFDTVEVGRTALNGNSYSILTVDAREYLGIRNLPENPWDHDLVATQMTRLERKQTWLADNRGIFTSLVYPLAKALTFYRGRNPRGSYTDHVPGRDWAHAVFYYPIVVTSAPIYLVDAGLRPLEPKVVPWATMSRRIDAKNVSGQFNVDVVSESSIPVYLTTRVAIFMDAVGKIADAAPSRFITNKDHSYKPVGDRPAERS